MTKRAAESPPTSPRSLEVESLETESPPTRTEQLTQRLMDADMFFGGDADAFLDAMVSGDADLLMNIKTIVWEVCEQALIAQDFELFVEIFTHYCDTATEAHNEVGRRFCPSLRICLPADWKAADSAAMERAFNAIHVDDLDVILGDDDNVICADVCRCIEILLSQMRASNRMRIGLNPSRPQQQTVAS